MKSLHKEIPKRLLPIEYGGESGDIQAIINYWSNILMQKRDFFLEEENYKTDEKYRVGKSKTQSIFGTSGSFRTLDID